MPLAVPGPAVLAGTVLDVPTDEWRILPREVVAHPEAADGSRREVRLYAGDGLPRRVVRRRFTLAWFHVRSLRQTLEWLFAASGPYDLVLWREEYPSWPGTGGRTEFSLPNGWRLALDTAPAAAPPGGTYTPRVRVGMAGADLAYVSQDTATYEAGAPAVGEVWFETGGSRFKLAAPPAVGETVHAALVPTYRVYHSGELAEKRLTGPIREPEELVLLEA